MTQVMTGDEVADEICRDCGYEPELTRSLNGFQIFAIAFASMSVVMGIFATYDDMLRSSGPVGIWLFPVVGVGQLLVALVYAQLSARIPLSGGTYAWASRLANPRIGWAFGWLAVLGVTSPVAIDNALATQCLMPLFNMEPNETTGRVITVVLPVIQAALAIAATRIVGWVNSWACSAQVSRTSFTCGSSIAQYSSTSRGNPTYSPFRPSDMYPNINPDNTTRPRPRPRHPLTVAMPVPSCCSSSWRERSSQHPEAMELSTHRQMEKDCLGVDRGPLVHRHRDQLGQYRARQRECQAWGHRRDVREESGL
jgi:Amino acid permease